MTDEKAGWKENGGRIMWFCKSVVSRLEESGGKCVLALKTLLV